jgi:hypothetical protein
MPNERAEIGLSYAISAFQAILGIEGRRFGAANHPEWGVSDGNEGVQWNIDVNLDIEAARLGVNLEGMKYNGWPIATFIENELNRSMLLEIVPQMEGHTDICVAFYRDAWQATARPRIQENPIGRKAIRLNELTYTGWKRILEEAYACLDPTRNHRGRTKQIVTLTHRGRREMQVSPHLRIYTQVWDSTPVSADEAQARVRAAFHELVPIYEVVVSQSR